MHGASGGRAIYFGVRPCQHITELYRRDIINPIPRRKWVVVSAYFWVPRGRNIYDSVQALDGSTWLSQARENILALYLSPGRLYMFIVQQYLGTHQ